MKTKIKLLDGALLSIIAAMAAVPAAQAENDRTAAQDAPPMACDTQGCRQDEQMLFQLRTRSWDRPLSQGTDARSGSQALQPDRRVSIIHEQGSEVAPGTASISGKFMLELPAGGVVWATEDPSLGTPELTIGAPGIVAFNNGQILKPLDFYSRSNYAGFVQRYELLIYRATDVDLVDPLVTLDMPVANVSRITWDGRLPERYRYRQGDQLSYVLRAYGADGNVDETQPRQIQLVTQAEADGSGRRLREATEKAHGSAMSLEQAQQQSLIDEVFSGNGLRQQNIAIRGSRVRIQGRNIADGTGLTINGESYPVDLERKFVAEYLMPVGRHDFVVGVRQGEQPAQEHALTVDVSGRYFFGVGLADVTIAQNKVGGSTAAMQVDPRYADDIISDGRLAFYGKAKLGGRYLITAQADTTQRDLEHLFDGFGKADPVDIFRRLDPDLYYPVYGDDSTTWRDVDTMGRFYLRVDWDKNQALWGNYATGLTGTEYGQYVRSLYGAAVNWRSHASNAWGDAKTELRLFASEAQTAPGHSEFIGTGGSLYYLRHTDILPGSDQVVLEVRDATTGRTERRVVLERGADYEIDELQGRIILTRPLAQVTLQNMPSLTRTNPLDGLEQRLLVDYEWVPTGFDPDEVTAGGRARHWFGDSLGIGLTHVQENRGGQDYQLSGADITLQAGRGTYLKAEVARTEATATPVFFSDNGGLSFTQLNTTGPQEGQARAVEARVNLRELGWTERDWSAAAWWRDVEAGYSTGRMDRGADIREVGTEVLGQLTSNLGLYLRATRADRDGESLRQAQLTAQWDINDARSLSAELRRLDERRLGGAAAGTLAAVKFLQRFGSNLELYATGQLTVDDDGGAYADNNALMLGGKYLFGNLSSIGGEVSTGDRGEAVSLNGEYRLAPDHTLYGNYTWSTDSTGYDPLFNPSQQNGWTLGQRWRLSNQVSMYNESQQLKSRMESGLAHTFGMDFLIAQGWNSGFALQHGELENATGGLVKRKAVSLNGGHTSVATDWNSKLEWRRDSGAEQREQWVSTNRLTHRINDSWRIAARFNYSHTEDRINALADARFIEGNVGFAWRPWDSTRWAVFGRYTYLYDLSTLGQISEITYDQRTQVLSLEGIYQAGRHWEVAAKLARREGEVRYGRGSGPWFDSATTFAAAQLRYDLRQQWHALAEYRWLDVDNGGSRSGFLVGVDRDINRNFRVGVGYNFTDFSDDLTNFDYDHRGFFINLTGVY